MNCAFLGAVYNKLGGGRVRSDEALIFHGLLRSKAPSSDLIAKCLRAIRHIDTRSDLLVEASRLLPGASDFLPDAYARALVRADITIEDAAREILSQKKFMCRLSGLLPGMLEQLHVRTVEQMQLVLTLVDDCFNDFKAAKNAPRKDRVTREAVTAIDNALKATSAAGATLELVAPHVDVFLSEALAADASCGRDLSENLFDQFVRSLKLCSAALEIIRERATTEADFLITPDNRAKTSVVEYAHEICLLAAGPELRTSPNSEFAGVTSLLFEIVSGVRDQSLPGTIIRYARSRERRDRENRERKYREQVREFGTAPDNFELTRERLDRHRQQISAYLRVIERKNLSAAATELLIKLCSKEVDAWNALHCEFGPHLVHVNDKLMSVEENSVEMLEQKRVALEIEIGKLRRAIDPKRTDSAELMSTRPASD